MKRIVAMIWMLVGLTFGLHANNAQSISVEKEIDWQAQQIRFTLRVAVDQQALPNSRQQAEGWIERERFRLIAQSLGDVVLDAQGSFRENAPRKNQVHWNLNLAATHAQREYAVLSADLRYLEAVYTLSITDLMRHISVDVKQRVLPLLTTNQREFEYSGIVIFVKSSLPIHGKFNQFSALEPALAPAIFDESGETLLSLATINSRLFSEGKGGLSYTFDTNSQHWSPLQVGFNPLILSAVAVTGEYHITDIVLAQRDADRLRASAQAIEMLHNAKVLVVIQP